MKDGVTVQVCLDPELIAKIQARSVRTPDRDVGNVTCWREGSTEHYFVEGGYWYSLPFIRVNEGSP